MSGTPDPTDFCKTCEPQPIGTAPRNGKIFLGLDYLGYPHIVWGDDRGFFDDRGGERCEGLEWWSPIPGVPSNTGAP